MFIQSIRKCTFYRPNEQVDINKRWDLTFSKRVDIYCRLTFLFVTHIIKTSINFGSCADILEQNLCSVTFCCIRFVGKACSIINIELKGVYNRIKKKMEMLKICRIYNNLQRFHFFKKKTNEPRDLWKTNPLINIPKI